MAPLNSRSLFPRIQLEHETGESAEGEIYLERLIQSLNQAGSGRSIALGRAIMAIAASVRITGALDRMETAEAAIETVLSDKSIYHAM